MESSLISRLQDFMENEARSCSMDIGGMTPLYVYRMWGGKCSIEEIEHGLSELRRREARNHGFRDSRSHGQRIKTTWGSGFMVNG